jgi:hypothetical protein
MTSLKIIDYVLAEHKDWVSKLTPENIGNILNTLANIPNMKINGKSILSNSSISHNLNSEMQSEMQYDIPGLKSDIPSVKGKIGENMFEDIVSKFMSSDYELINVAKQGKAGDFMIKWRSFKTNKLYKIIIDIKNYNKSSVPTLEVEKFYRDVHLNNVNGGLLLSYNSHITGTSKIIELKELLTDKGIVPLLFVQSNTPLVIVEIIKLLFHIIEIKDINNNSVCKNNELIYHINQLNDSIQNITDCRDILQNSKNDIEKSLNTIMLKLMSCEYNLVSKINQINSTLINVNELKCMQSESKEKVEKLEKVESEETVKFVEVAKFVEAVSPVEKVENIENIENIEKAENIKSVEPKSIYDTSIDIIKTVRNSFNFITDNTESYLYNIYKFGWDLSSIDISKKTWTLSKNLDKLIFVIKFMKTNTCVVISKDFISVSSVLMSKNINELTKLNKLKKITKLHKLTKIGTLDSICIHLDTVSIVYIKNIYNCIMELE